MPDRTNTRTNIALQVVTGYASAMYEADLWRHEERKRICRERSVTSAEDETLFREALARKRAAYERFWREEDRYWEPCSVDWPSGFEPNGIKDWAAFEVKNGTVVVSCRDYNFAGTEQRNRYTVVFFQDGPRIVSYEHE